MYEHEAWVDPRARGDAPSQFAHLGVALRDTGCERAAPSAAARGAGWTPVALTISYPIAACTKLLASCVAASVSIEYAIDEWYRLVIDGPPVPLVYECPLAS